MTSNEQVISTLNNLIEVCRDGQDGFETAAAGVRDEELRTLFHTYAEQRGQFAGELRDEVRRLGGEPETTGSIAAAIHRGWINIKAVITGQDDGAILAECERGEDAAVKSFRQALDRDLPTNVRAIIQRQFSHIREAHERIVRSISS
jgi:uncharacterized protein (TIGR02284 family)